MSDDKQKLEVVCPKCQRTEIITVPDEPMPTCEDCKIPMVVKELLTEGKSY